MPLSLSDLSSNFKEVYFETLDSGEPNLVPSLFSDRLYARRTWLGRMWTVIIAICGIFCGGGAKLKCARRKKILEKIEESFRKFKAEIKPIFQRFQELIGDRCEGYLDNENLFKNLRYQVNNWNTKTLPFLKLIQKSQREKVQKIFKDAIPELGKSALFGENLYTESLNYQALIDLEAMRGENLPYHSLGKLALDKPLVRKEETDLEEWITATESSNVKQKKLHTALKALVHNLKTYNRPRRKPSVARLEIALIQKGLATILKEDPKHVKWRNSLKMGDVVEINGKRHELGQSIMNFNQGRNQNRVFLSVDTVDRVIIIGKNLATLKIRRESTKSSSEGIESPEWFEIDKEGRAGIQEKMLKHISGIVWKSEQQLVPEDKPIARAFIGFIKFMKQINKSPKNLPHMHIYFDKECALKCTKPTTLGEFDYALLERFAFQAARKNLHIFKLIVDESELIQHSHARYFEDIITSFERQQDLLDAQSMATLTQHSITTVSTVDAGTRLQKKVDSLFNKIEKKIKKNYRIEDENFLKTVLRTHIRDAYLASTARSFFSPKFKKIVLNNLISDMRPVPKGDTDDYY